MAKVSTRLQATSALAGVALAAFGAMGDAHAGDGKTVGEVASMPGGQGVQYIYDIAAERSLTLARRFGDSASQCLRKEFVTINQTSDGSIVLPRGLKSAITSVHRLNSTGDSSASADDAVIQGVNWVATNVCKLPADAVSLASLDND
ncbi:MAG: hypothetical protein JJ959_02885 [Nisaea sp.]|uniref:hypothetical protein n=1 Tax=Nisaea sp. TaxID=2024842 RepID=UPI001B082DC1|nr:hypothetical protein [Nisaea sp.]MBO6559449.1 hypothetical protein [Nisaea sp.]